MSKEPKNQRGRVRPLPPLLPSLPSVKAAFEHTFLLLPARTQNLLRQQFRDGLTVVELGALYHVHHATAARWIALARTELNRRTRKELKLRLRLSTSECDSIVRLAGSNLAQSLSGLFRGTPASS